MELVISQRGQVLIVPVSSVQCILCSNYTSLGKNFEAKTSLEKLGRGGGFWVILCVAMNARL